MIWQNPWAWLGLAAIAIPILIHLLGRDRAPTYSFPSLRFIEIAELPPTRRTRIHDVLLLATRVAILGVAVAALAQPMLLLASRRAAIDDRLARAIVVDTSASMARPTPSGNRAVDSARSIAKGLAGDAQSSMIIETTSPRSVIDGAVGWLASQRSRRELVVVSDFQVGTLDSAILSAVPEPMGVRAVGIPTNASTGALDRTSVARVGIVARIDVANDSTNVAWSLGGDVRDPRIDVDAGDVTASEAVSTASKVVGVAAPIDTSTRVTVLFRNARDRTALARRATPISSPRLIDIVARARGDSLLALVGAAPIRFARGAVDTSASRAGAVAAEDTASGAHRLLVFSNDSLGSARSAALVGALRRALSVASPVTELDPSAIAPGVIASWQRAPSAEPTRETVDQMDGPSDGRWLWLIVLGLLGIESWLRRERRASTVRVDEQVRDRAA
jgi:hypothetical protein